MPKVSVIIPTYNSAHFLTESINSALNQTYKDIEIIVIDDGSTDNTKEIINSFISKNLIQFIYIYQENQGVVKARNAGLERSSGEYIALLDADDIWLPNRLEESVKAIESSSAIGLVHSNITKISKNGEVIETPKRNKKYLSGIIFKYIFLRKAHLSCPTILFRKECCYRVGKFDENLSKLGCEDRDLWLRIAKESQIVYIDKVLAYYRVFAESMSHDHEKMIKARLYVIDKYCPEGSKDQKLRNLALSKVYRDLGDQYLIKENFNEAKLQYHKAIKYNPVCFWPRVNLLKTLFRKS